MSETKQTEYTVEDFQAIVQKALNDPDFAEQKAQWLAFFKDDAEKFKDKVPKESQIQVKEILKLLKELDPKAHKLIKPLRTAIGLLEDSLRVAVHQSLNFINADLKAGKLSASAAHALIYLMILDPLRYSYNKYMPAYQDDEMGITPSYIERLAQNPQAVYWLRCFASAYLVLLDDCDPAYWNILAKGTAEPQACLDTNWLMAFLQLVAIERLSAPTEA